MQSVLCKVGRGAPAETTVLLYVLPENRQLADRARQLGVTAVALPSAKKLVASTEGFWQGGNLVNLSSGIMR